MYEVDVEEEELDPRQLEVLTALSEDENATYTFQGLRRKLGLHQEMLSRTLDRLEAQDLVKKTSDGYRINCNKRAYRFGYVAEAMPIETKAVTAHFPCDVDVSFVLKMLKGRWFREFRWLGYAETPSGLTLSWITDDGQIQLRAKVLKNTLTISALYGSKDDQEKATTSAFELFDFVNRVTRQDVMPPVHDVPN